MAAPDQKTVAVPVELWVAIRNIIRSTPINAPAPDAAALWHAIEAVRPPGAPQAAEEDEDPAHGA